MTTTCRQETSASLSREVTFVSFVQSLSLREVRMANEASSSFDTNRIVCFTMQQQERDREHEP